MQEKNAKIVCLVPSWTETLIECGVEVVGRTRFCIHPAEKVKSIKVVGGTKNMNLQEIIALKPDYVLLDQEENKLEMAEQLKTAGIQLIVSHVQSVKSAADFLLNLGALLKNAELIKAGEDYHKVLKSKVSRSTFFRGCVLKKNSEIDVSHLNYVIWKNPYMIIGEGTFISDVFSLIGVEFKAEEKYPKIAEEELKKTCCLFSSEPYPFAKEFQQLTDVGFKGALVDGEKISWYGIRNIKFLLSSLE
ncbi:MAG: ABC transporter substrate-binding protein [Pseudobdellovibrio sp.]